MTPERVDAVSEKAKKKQKKCCLLTRQRAANVQSVNKKFTVTKSMLNEENYTHDVAAGTHLTTYYCPPCVVLAYDEGRVLLPRPSCECERQDMKHQDQQQKQEQEQQH